ncbi:hypothetical protein IID22_05385 [Patescibacteria group bacterium]|nr:hypothetical protein [Patescibacteria group bacterium]
MAEVAVEARGLTRTYREDERQVNALYEFDIKVEAPTVDGPQATIVVEIKWSDNKEVSTSLEEQLGCKYLLKGKGRRWVLQLTETLRDF